MVFREWQKNKCQRSVCGTRIYALGGILTDQSQSALQMHLRELGVWTDFNNCDMD